MKNVPKLRFKDDNGRDFPSWESHPLGTLGEFKNGINKPKEDFGKGVPFINLMDVFGKPCFSGGNVGLVNAKPNEISNYNLLKGDVLFIRSSVKVEGVGETSVIIEDLPNTVYSGFLIRFRENKNRITDLYKKYCFGNRHFRNQVLSVCTTSANTNINQDALNNLTINLPILAEQTKIADFLTAIDDRISQLSQKCDGLAQYKKGVMQKIFSQELRFKDEKGRAFPAWEERQFGDFLTESKVKGNSGNIARKLTVKLWGKGVFEKVEKREGSENTQYYVRKKGQFIYSKLDFLNCAFGIIPPELDGYESTIDLPCFDFDNSACPIFICKLVQLESFYKKHGDIADGGRKAKRIHANDFLRMYINFPCLAEQEKIAGFLSAVDEKISHAQSQLAALKQYKQGLLQQMFV